ncbi:MAG: response regulator [Ruminococcus sp.]|jgi:putative two-component system response regulator|nr:response regulator [Ruminococcus sp.]
MSAAPIVLIVDDDPVQLNTVVSVLQKSYKCVPTTSGKTALKYFETHTADIVLLDYNMPDLTGIEVMKRMQETEHTASIPVIFLTGVDDTEGEVSALRMGAVDYIVKPIRPAVLLTRVKNQLELAEHRRDLEYAIAERTEDLWHANERLKKREDSTLHLLARITDMRDEDTGGHILRTTGYTKIIVTHLREDRNPPKGYEISEDEAQSIIKCAQLHDLGKIAIPDSILLKPAKLTPEEFEVIKKHPIYGERFFADFIKSDSDDPFLETAREITYSHHEKWNGTGYPLGLSGMDIPLSGRIVAIADVYDALVSERPYKKPFPHEKAAEIIISDSGKHFDPHLVEIFTAHQDEFIAVSKITDTAPKYDFAFSR